MSLCRSRLFLDSTNQAREDGLSVVQMFEESDCDDGEENGRGVVSLENPFPSFTDIQVTPEVKTPVSSPVKTTLNWDSGLGSPSPVSPRSMKEKSSPIVNPGSPIPFNLYDSDENVPVCPPTPFTPPHKKFRALRLYDTPHTPKSLLQKAQRRVTRSNATTSTAKRDQNLRKPPSVRNILDPEGPQANVNPFTPESPVVKGKKRARNVLDG